VHLKSDIVGPPKWTLRTVIRMKEGISFVVPVHNGGASIEDAIAAIAAEVAATNAGSAAVRPFEIIVVDHASPDASSPILPPDGRWRARGWSGHQPRDPRRTFPSHRAGRPGRRAEAGLVVRAGRRIGRFVGRGGTGMLRE